MENIWDPGKEKKNIGKEKRNKINNCGDSYGWIEWNRIKNRWMSID